MATCKKCGASNLDWVNENGKWKLYNYITGGPHNGCTMTAQEYKALKRESNVCRHGILKDRPCDMCEDEL